MKILVSAFEPFAGAKTNSSLIVAQQLSKMDWKDQVYFHYPLKVTYQDAWTQLLQKIESDGPYDGIIALGQAETRTKIALERVALNWIDARMTDNSGVEITNQKIRDGSELLWSTIPWEKFELLHNCERSYSAGTFVCNHLMFELLNWNLKYQKLAGFIHLPLVHGQEEDFPGKPTHSLSEITFALHKLIQFVLSLQK